MIKTLIILFLSFICFFPIQSQGFKAPMIKVHFTVLTKNPKAHRLTKIDILKNEIIRLNRKFVDKNDQPLVKFVYDGKTSYHQIKAYSNPVIKEANSKIHFDQWKRKVKNISNPYLFKPGMINVFIIDTFKPRKGFKDSTSYGYFSSTKGYVLLDYVHLNRNGFVLFHEMCHVFGLKHLCASKSSSNIMASIKTCKGEKSFKKEIEIYPITKNQATTIQKRAEIYFKNFRKFKSYQLIQNAGFENRLLFWQNTNRGRYRYFRKSGIYSAYLKQKEYIKQYVYIKKSGTYTLSAYFWNPKGRSVWGIKAGKKSRHRVLPRKKPKKFTKYTIHNINLQKGDEVLIFVFCLRGMVLIDDFELKKTK